MKKLICMLLALGCVFALAACGEAEPATNENTTTVETTENVPGETTAEVAEDTTVADTTVLYTIKVVDEAGNPVKEATIAQICDETCMPVKLVDGVGEKKIEPNENYHANLTIMPDGYEYATGEEEYYFDETYTCTIVLKAVA